MVAALPIRLASLADAGAIAEAERICFGDPWSAASIIELFDNHTVVGFVAAEDGPKSRLAGYAFARVIAGEAEILNLAVLPGSRRQGIGGRLLDTTLSALRENGADQVFLEVRESNDDAKGLYAARGFRPVGLRADYYRKPRENALILRLDLKSAVI